MSKDPVADVLRRIGLTPADLDPDVLDPRRVGAAVDHPGWVDGTLRAEVSRLHEALVDPAEAFEAEDRLASVAARLDALLGAPQPSRHVDHGTASRLRELLDARTGTGLTLVEAARLVGPVLGWSDEQVAREVEHYVKRVEAERESQRMPDDETADAARMGAPEIVPVR